MPRRTRIAEGCYEDRFGLAACVKVGSVQKEKRWPSGTLLSVLKAWRRETRQSLLADRVQQQAQAATLRVEADAWLAEQPSRAGAKSDRAHLRAWYPRFGERPRRSITATDLEQQLAAWKSVPARTLRHRVRMFRTLWHALDGPHAATPADDLTLPRLPKTTPQIVPLKTVQKVLDKLKAAGLMKDYARLLVRATTGQRPIQIMQTTADMVDLTRKVWLVPPAKGGHPIVFPLDRDSLAAWKAFIAAQAWGSFDTTRAAYVLRAHGWPQDIKPYNARHTFVFEVAQAGADLRDIQGLLGHRQIQTTTIYTPFLQSRMTKALKNRKQKLRA